MTTSYRRLTRSRTDRWLGGVCGGLGDYLGVDANLVRLVVAVCTLLGAGTLIIAYLVALFLIPREDTYVHPDASPPAGQQD